MNRHILAVIAIIAALVFGLTACGPQPDVNQAAEESNAEEALGAEVLALPDTTGESLWAFLDESDYRATWPMWPGKTSLYEGREPHGMLLTTYVNALALGAINTKAGFMPDGAIIVKENYRPDSTLAAITVMRKADGYNASHNDWFFAKYLPTGDVESGPDGMSLEGKVPSCQSCHAEQNSNDYLFTGEIR